MTESPFDTIPRPDATSTAFFLVIVAYVAVVFGYAVVRSLSGRQRTAVAMATFVWLSATGVLARTGALESVGLPPPMMFVFVAMLLLALGFALSPLGGHVAQTLPLWTLVAAQAFRLPLELVMHHWANTGTFPVEMTFAGYNKDIVAGGLAIVVGSIAFWKGAKARPVVIAYNVIGLGLLGVIAVVSMGSVPTPFSFIDASVPLVLPARFPYIWLPTVCVAFALVAHVVSLRQWLNVPRN